MRQSNDQCNFFAKVPNNEEGRFFLFLLDKYLNKNSYYIRKRGRWPNHELMKKEGIDGRVRFWQSVPVKYAMAFNLYLYVKPSKDVPELNYGGIVGIGTLVGERKYFREAYNKRNIEEVHKQVEIGLRGKIAELEAELSKYNNPFMPRYEVLKKPEVEE
jgi:hypothetical protein